MNPRIVLLSLTGCLCLGGGLAVAETPEPAADVKVPLHEGVGSAHIPINTSSELAQKYFDQVVRLHYGFWISEARAPLELNDSVRTELIGFDGCGRARLEVCRSC